MNRLWARLPFIGRLLVTASLALLLAGLAMVLISARQEAAEIRADLARALDKELEIMPAALAETVVVGDFSTLQQTLDRYIARPLIAGAEFRDVSGTLLVSRSDPETVKAPAWFLRLFAFADLQGAAPVIVGGRNYGSLHLTVTVQGLAGRAWSHLLGHMGILLLAILIDFVGIWLVLRSGLAPLKLLGEAAGEIAAGRLDVRLSAKGSPELRHLIGSFNHMVSSVQQGQRALRESEERLSFAINAVNDGIWDWNLQTGGLYLSPKWKSMLGHAEDELPSVYATFEQLLHPDDRPRVERVLQDYLAGQTENYRVEFRMRHKDGSWRWILSRGEVSRDEWGAPRRMAGSHTDVTLVKQLEAELRERMQQWSAILDNSSVGISYVRERKLVWANQRMGEIFGYAGTEMPGLDTRDFYISDAEHAALGGRAYPVLAAGQRYIAEQQMRDRSGRPVWVRISGKAIDPADPVAGSIWIFEDIAEQKATEHALIQAREAADAANVAKSRFLATMSHEIRTPMNGILGMAQMLLFPGVGEAERLDYARTILNSGQTLLTLLNDILDLSKVEAGKLELERAPYDPAQVVHEIGSLFAEAARAKGLEFAGGWSGPERQRYVGDVYRLRQMLSNLVGNAIKFTAAGSVRLEAAEIKRDGEVAELEYSVVDTGMGIPGDKLALLFQPFSQADSSITRQFSGTGLGLSIVRSLAQMMGGQVGVDSEPGRGSRFWFRIPTRIVAGGQETRRGERGTPPGDMAGGLRGGVLVVEDNANNRIVISALLRKLGLDVVVAEDGQQGVDTVSLRGAAIDLVLMDIQMPVLDGYAATGLIRQWEQANARRRLPIIALTADAYDEDRRHALDCGMDDFMAKPVDLATLRRVLARWLSARPVLSAVDAGQAGKMPEREILLPRIEEVLRLLAENRFNAIPRFNELQALVAGSELADPIAEAGKPLAEMLFALARERLLDIVQTIGWTTETS